MAETVSPEQFEAMGYPERVDLLRRDPDQYRNLVGDPAGTPQPVPRPTPEQFRRMGYAERVAVHRDHPELYAALAADEQT